MQWAMSKYMYVSGGSWFKKNESIMADVINKYQLIIF